MLHGASPFLFKFVMPFAFYFFSVFKWFIIPGGAFGFLK